MPKTRAGLEKAKPVETCSLLESNQPFFQVKYMSLHTLNPGEIIARQLLHLSWEIGALWNGIARSSISTRTSQGPASDVLLSGEFLLYF